MLFWPKWLKLENLHTYYMRNRPNSHEKIIIIWQNVSINNALYIYSLMWVSKLC